jgi:O-antigen/teichoic acid export membrane protein
MSQSLRRSALSGAAWSYLGSAAILTLQTAYTATTARLISPAGFGAFALAMTIIQFAGYFANAGLSSSLVRAPSLDEAELRAGLTISLGAGTLLAIVLFAMAPLFSSLWHTSAVAPMLRLLAIHPLLVALGAAPIALLRRRLLLRRVVFLEVLGSIIGIAISLSCAFMDVGPVSLVFLPIASAGTILLGSWYIARTPMRPSFDLSRVATIMNFSSQVTGQNLVHYIANSLPIWLAGRLFGANVTGQYSRASNLAGIPLAYITTGISRTLYPIYAVLQSRRQRLASATTDVISVVSFLAFLVFGMLAGFAPELVAILLGPRWHLAGGYLTVLCGIAALDLIYSRRLVQGCSWPVQPLLCSADWDSTSCCSSSHFQRLLE